MLPVNRTDRAKTDLAEILDYLEERNPSAAVKLAAKVDAICRLLGQFPGMGRARDELMPGLRSVVVGSYVLFYRATQLEVQIVRILFGKRDLERIFEPPDDQ